MVVLQIITIKGFALKQTKSVFIIYAVTQVQVTKMGVRNTPHPSE